MAGLMAFTPWRTPVGWPSNGLQSVQMAVKSEYPPNVDLEASPSTGPRETAAAMSAVYGLGRRRGDRWGVAV